MKIISSYDVELRKQNIPIRQTLDIYRSAVSCLIEIYAQTWDELAWKKAHDCAYPKLQAYPPIFSLVA